MVLRRESFAGHTLAVIGFPGAAAAAWLGVAVGYGYVAACLAAAVTIAACSPLARAGGVGGFSEGSAVIGTLQAVALATGLLFVSLYHGFLSGLTNLLFGTIAGVSGAQVRLVGAAAVVCLAVLAAVGRPLLFTSIDPVAAALMGSRRDWWRRCLVVLGITAGAASELTGSLLVFALLVAPAAAAQQLTSSPSLGIITSVLVALAITWMGMGAAFFSPYPIGFWVASLGYGSYLAVLGWRTAIRRLGAVAVPGRRDHEG
jgi:zinc/manganese transport system permease protein